MGDLPPLGYDVEDRKLVINHKEADTVKEVCYIGLAKCATLRLLRF